MTDIFNDVIPAGQSSEFLAVTALEPHGVNPSVQCQVFSRNASTGDLFELALLQPNEARVIFPTTDQLVVSNLSAVDGRVQITGK